jgi:hypothetical protein
VKELALLLERRLRGGAVAILEECIGTYVVEQPAAHVDVRSADVIDAEPPLAVRIAKGIDAGRLARHDGVDVVERQAVGAQ